VPIKPDPKPGRWILPLVILGMVGFTYMVVRSIEPATSLEGTTTVTEAAAAPDESTTTTVDPAIAAYLQALEEEQTESQAILAEGEAINARWDAREQDYQTTLDQFRELRDRAQVFADSVDTQTPPAGLDELATAHAQVIAASDRILGAAEALISGLQAPDQGQQRSAALESLRQATTDFAAAVEAARGIAAS
jgi:hypothetical protein